MAFWLAFLYALIASYVIGGLLAEFPDDVAPDDSDPFNSPQSTPANPVPIVYGTRRIRGVNVLWYGSISFKNVTQKFKAGWKSKTVTIGHKYFVGIQLGIAYGFTGMVLKDLYVGEDRVFPRVVTRVSSSISFTDSTPDFIIENNGTLEEFSVLYPITVEGSALNDGTYDISNIFEGNLALAAGSGIVTEAFGAQIILTQTILGDIESGSSGFFSALDLYGGEAQGGGVEGLIRFYNGVDALAIPPLIYDAFNQDDQFPHYKSVAQITLSDSTETTGMYVGTQKQVRAISAVVRNTDFIAGGGEPFTDGLDVNPVTVLRHLIVSDSRFLLLTGEEVDLTSLNDAEQVVFDEGLMFSPIFARAKATEKMLEVILKFIDAVFYTDPLTGLLTLKLLRETTPTGNEVVLDVTNVTKIIKTKFPDRSKNVNEIKMTFTDREHNYENRTITAQDLAGFIAAGSVHNTKTISYPSICTIAVARQVCDRDLMQLAAPVTTVELETKRVLATTKIGEQVVINLPEIGVESEFFRVADIDYGKVADGKIKATLISDVYTGSIAMYSQESGTKFVDPVTESYPTEITDAVLVELPRILLRRLVDISETTGTDLEWGVFVLAPRTDPNNMSFDIYVDENELDIYSLTKYDGRFTPSSVLLSDFDRFDADGVDYLDNTYRLQFTLPDADLDTSIVLDSQNQAEPIRYAYLNGEWLMYTSLVDLGGGVYSLKDLRRGALDSPPRDHVIDDKLFFVSDSEMLVSDSGFLFSKTTSVQVKLDPRGFSTKVGLANIVGSNIITSENRAFKPLSVHWLKFGTLFYKTFANPHYGDPLVLTWRHHNRESYDSNWLQENVDDIEDVVSYTINVYEADEVTLIGTYPLIEDDTWEYTKAMEVEDHGANVDELVFEIVTVHDTDGECLTPRKEHVHFGTGFGFHFGQNFGN